MQWIAEHQKVITALTGVGTLLVWMIYLQVFVTNYRRQIRATLLISRGAGKSFDAHCFLSNMSAGPVYVQSVIVTLETQKETLVCPVTDILQIEGDAPADALLRTRQGPIGTGDIRDVGTFDALVRHGLRSRLGDDGRSIERDTIRCIMIEVIGVYGGEDLPVGARRRFVVRASEGSVWIEGEELETVQIRSKRERRRLVADLERDR